MITHNHSYKYAGKAFSQNDAAEILTAWRRGNDAGEGFIPVAGDEYVPSDYDDACEAMYQAEGWQIIGSTNSGDNVSLWKDDDDRIISMADANGAWAVDVTDKIPDYITR